MAWQAIAAMAAQTGIQMYGSYLQGKNANIIAKYNAKVAEDRGNAQKAAIEADMVNKIGEGRRELNAVTQNLNNRGFDISTGSPLLLLSENYADSNADLNEMQRQANIAKLQGDAEAAMLRWQGKQAKKLSYLGLGGSAVQGVSQVASTYQQAKYDDARMKKLDTLLAK